jgi:hypothetical protein
VQAQQQPLLAAGNSVTVAGQQVVGVQSSSSSTSVPSMTISGSSLYSNSAVQGPGHASIAAITHEEAATANTITLCYSGAVVENKRPRIPTANTVKEALEQWLKGRNEGHPHAQHPYALREWPVSWRSNARTASKDDKAIQMIWIQRRILGDAYSELNEGSVIFSQAGFARFCQKWPQTSVKQCLLAIQAEYKARGVIIGRKRKDRAISGGTTDSD